MAIYGDGMLLGFDFAAYLTLFPRRRINKCNFCIKKTNKVGRVDWTAVTHQHCNELRLNSQEVIWMEIDEHEKTFGIQKKWLFLQGAMQKWLWQAFLLPSFEYLHIDSHMSRYSLWILKDAKAVRLMTLKILQNSIRCLMMLFLVTYCVIDT